MLWKLKAGATFTQKHWPAADQHKACKPQRRPQHHNGIQDGQPLRCVQAPGQQQQFNVPLGHMFICHGGSTRHTTSELCKRQKFATLARSGKLPDCLNKLLTTNPARRARCSWQHFPPSWLLTRVRTNRQQTCQQTQAMALHVS
jgi:hypothetical protein